MFGTKNLRQTVGPKIQPAQPKQTSHLSQYASYFDSNPHNKLFTIGFWIKVLSPQSTTQTIVGTGRADRDTGILLQVAEYASKIKAWIVTTRNNRLLTCDVGDTLTSWTHIALVASKQGEASSLWW